MFRRVDECHNTTDARRVDVVVREGINKGALDELLQAAFTAQLEMFRSQIQEMVAEVIHPLREASIDVGLGGFFGLCSPVLRTSSPSSMVASHAACCAAYEDKGGLSIRVHSEKMHDVASPEDGVEGALLEHQSEAWVDQASALSD
jgi:hypothetical protein